ncbi:MAG TPA: cytochrome C [Planctomycetota bacterium]|nr:cytochrome C [Planctomycetota bacterium]
MDWHQLWKITSAPDNVPIVIMLFLIPFYTWYGFREAFRNDRLIAKLEADPELAKTHHRKTQPYVKGWDQTVHVWPYLLKVELLAAIVVTLILVVWSICLDAPLEEPANPNLTMNPSKAPWYFLGLQEMLVYFDPWIAGVVLPSIILVGLMAIPYIDVNPRGNGYYTYRQRKFSIWMFLIGFLVLWLVLIIIGTFIRGPGWMWFWPGETWDHHRIVHSLNVDLHEALGFRDASMTFKTIFGLGVVGAYLAGGHLLFLTLFKKYAPELVAKLNPAQLHTTAALTVMMFGLPLKMAARLMFNIKYVCVTPWFNI